MPFDEFPLITKLAAAFHRAQVTHDHDNDTAGRETSRITRVRLGAVALQIKDRERLFESLSKVLNDDADLEYALIDGAIVQVHQKATGEKGGLKLVPSGVRAEG